MFSLFARAISRGDIGCLDLLVALKDRPPVCLGNVTFPTIGFQFILIIQELIIFFSAIVIM